MGKVKYPGKRVTINGNILVSTTETLISEAGVFYPITPSTEMGEHFQDTYAKGKLNAFGKSLIAIETEGEHAAQGGAIAISVTGKRAVNFTSGQGIVYGAEQYYHAPGKLSTMVVEVGARALTKHALNVHCGHDDVYSALDNGWNITFSKDAQQAADQAIILRKVNEMSLNPGMNVQDGFLTTHLERTFLQPEASLIREFLGSPDDMIDCPTEAQKSLFGNKRRRVPLSVDLKNPVVLGPVQNQEHYMNGVAARRNNFSEHILSFFERAYDEFGELTGRKYGLISQYNCENSNTVFVALGSAVENIEAVVDYIKETRNENVGVIHVNVMRPFPENAIINALKGNKNVIVLERSDEPLSGDNPLTRDIKIALSKAAANYKSNSYENIDSLDPNHEMPEIGSGVYGLGSRDFRPEGIIGAYDFINGKGSRQDGKTINDGARFFFLGIDHPYSVISDETPSCLPAKSIAVRFHSIGGWGMITTGKNLGVILGDFASYIAKRDNQIDEDGELKEIIHISANPKYGSEKKGAPTNYFLVAAPERIRVNCDLRHVNVVLCCDPKIFLHTNPLNGLEKGGAFVWESSESSPESAWQRIPKKYRQEIIEKEIKIYILDGFAIARKATSREDLQTRMQGNAFLGAFFGVSSFLDDYNIPKEEFLNTVNEQYKKKFGRFGKAVVESNMTVMQEGFDRVIEVKLGDENAPDTSLFCSDVVLPCQLTAPFKDQKKDPMFSMAAFDKEFRSGLGYDQPSSALASVGIVAAGTGATASKYIARREVPVFIAENCTQCMECITVCPDTALPNTAQEIGVILKTIFQNYVSDNNAKDALIKKIPELDVVIRKDMLQASNSKPAHEDNGNESNNSFKDIVIKHLKNSIDNTITEDAVNEAGAILFILPLAYEKVKALFAGKEKKEPGSGGVFSIFVSDLCKGCGACVEACGNHEALKMVEETEEIHASYESASVFLKFLRDTPQKYLGLFNADNPEESKAAVLKNHLMMQSKYSSIVSGDGACAGCGEKSVLRSVSTITEALMRPLFKAKSARLKDKAKQIKKVGLQKLAQLKKNDEASYTRFRRSVLHILMGYGGKDFKETDERIKNEFKGNDQDVIEGITSVMLQESFNHTDLQTIEGFAPNGMSVMAMAANTGCNTVYGSTPPNNPHTYPWMNSLFQDGATIGWLIGESFIKDHAIRSVIPERFANILLSDSISFTDDDYFLFTHFSDMHMTDMEIMELPKVWVIGGDGGLGDIGFQNLSKAVLQNRPNVNALMLDTQVYSNTGGQNSDSSPLTGGFDMNQAGEAIQGKLTEMKSVAESFLGGHGSPFIAQISLANSGTFYKSILDGLCYRGMAFYQSYTTCQPEHGVPDYASQTQARNVRDSRGLPEFVFNSHLGESYTDALYIKSNPEYSKDWYSATAPVIKNKYKYTVAHWAFTEARFRLHHKLINREDAEKMISLEDQLQLVTMDDIIQRKHIDETHRSFIPDFGVYAFDYDSEGKEVYRSLSRQMVIFCVERRKAWRMLQSRAGIENEDYTKQKELLSKMDNSELSREDYLNNKEVVEQG